MSDNSPQFETEEEFLKWAKINWPPDPQFCAKHWARFATREQSHGALFSLMYITDLVFMDEELSKRAGGDPNTAMKLAAPFCCHYGDEVYEKVLEEINAPEEWYMDCLMKYGSPNRRCKGVLHEKCRQARESAG